MWLELNGQFFKKFTEGNARKLAVNFTDLVNARDSGFTRHKSAHFARAAIKL